jgi:tripartite-type tricarboxylate transporter receptor subunit TctC
MASGKLRILAVTSDKRSRFMREVPTFTEQGFATVAGNETYGLFLPPQTPADAVAAAAQAVQQASRSPALIAGLEQLGMDAIATSPSDYAQAIQRDRDMWKPIVLASGFRSDE